MIIISDGKEIRTADEINNRNKLQEELQLIQFVQDFNESPLYLQCLLKAECEFSITMHRLKKQKKTLVFGLNSFQEHLICRCIHMLILEVRFYLLK